jgi:glutamine synthetase
MILANEAAGIGIYDTHSEIGPGQFEIGDLDGLKRF